MVFIAPVASALAPERGPQEFFSYPPDDSPWQFRSLSLPEHFVAVNRHSGDYFLITPDSLRAPARDGALFGLRLVGARVARIRDSSAGRVYFADAYPGIDLVYYTKGADLEYDFVVFPGSDPRQIRLTIEGENAGLDSAGNLVITQGHARVTHSAPVAYQVLNGVRVAVTAHYRINAGYVDFALGDYDARYPLVIDPVIGYSNTVAQTNQQGGRAMAMDSQRNVYVIQNDVTTTISTRVEIVKFNAAGARVGAMTLVTEGGSAVTTSGNAVAVDPSDNVYVTGTIGPSAFLPLTLDPGITTAPTVIPGYQTTRGASTDAFLVKFDANLNPLYYTYLGGTYSDTGQAIAVDAVGGAYVVGSVAGCTGGCTSAFPGAARTGFQAVPGFNQDIFIVRIAPSGTAVDYYSYLGGSGTENGNALAVNAAGAAYIAGDTTSANLPLSASPLQSTLAGGSDAFVSVFNTADVGVASLRFSTYLGGNNRDVATAIAVDASGNVYVGGETVSTTFPTTASAFSTAYIGGNSDGFVSKFDLSPQLVYSTYFGGNGGGIDTIRGIALDSSATLYLSGYTDTPFPLVAAVQPTPGGARDGFVAKLETRTAGTAGLLFSTYIGGGGTDDAMGIAVDANGSIFTTGQTFGGADQDIYVQRMDVRADLTISQTISPAYPRPGDIVTYVLTVTNLGVDVASGVVVSDTVPAGVALSTVVSSQGSCAGTATVVCNLGTMPADASATITLRGNVLASGGVSNTATVRAPLTDLALGNNTTTLGSSASFCSGARATDCTVSISSGAGGGGGGAFDLWSLLALLGLYAVARPKRRRA